MTRVRTRISTDVGWTQVAVSVTVDGPMVPRSAYAKLVVMPAHAGRTAFGAASTARALINAQPTGA
jgi:hypothetical protein